MTPDLANLAHVVLDMDGTLYLGKTLFEETVPFLESLTHSGIGYSYVTNNCSKSRAEYAAHLQQLGIPAEPSTIWTSAHATIFYLQTKLPTARRIFVLGTLGLDDEFRQAGFEVIDDRPDAVVVGFDTRLTYDRLARTAYWISQQLPYIATHPDRVCPTDQPTVLPDCAAICALLEVATGRKPEAIPGKPSPAMLHSVLDRHGVKPPQAAMIGDRLYTDVRMARDAGCIAVLTLTGEAKMTDVEQCLAEHRPHVVVKNLGELTQMIEDARRNSPPVMGGVGEG